jgi:hypothetical protein
MATSKEQRDEWLAEVIAPPRCAPQHPKHRHDECLARAPGRCGLCDDNAPDPRDAEIARLTAESAQRRADYVTVADAVCRESGGPEEVAEIARKARRDAEYFEAAAMAADKEVERLRTALERYGQHEEDCRGVTAWVRANGTPCDCGLADALKEAKQP